MPFAFAGQLAQSAPTALPEDPLGLVAENLRHSHYGAIAVIDRVLPHDNEGNISTTTPARVVGLIEERDLSAAALPILAAAPRVMAVLPGEASSTATTPFSENSSLEQSTHENGSAKNGTQNGHAASGGAPGASTPQVSTVSVAQITARQVMRSDFGIVPAAFSLQNALLTLDRYNAAALPVIDGDGSYRGLISRADVVAALGANVRPPVVGGMATPLGVWLTDGRLQGGAPPLGLFLSGLVLAACLAVSQLIMLVGLNAINAQWGGMFASGRLGAMADGGNTFNLLVTIVQGVLFLGALRLTPMAGIHAAEHQTVWAMERGLALTPENVGQMPRAHPRCGTNLMALAGLMQIMLQHSPSYSGGTVLLVLLLTFLFWRQFGTFLQEYFTTRPATRKQLESGIKAGRDIMEKYQEQPRALPSLSLRLYNSGILLSGAGMILGLTAFESLFDLAARWLLKL
jgi:CBS domain-containing protein